jgi:hypothetical protein
MNEAQTLNSKMEIRKPRFETRISIKETGKPTFENRKTEARNWRIETADCHSERSEESCSASSFRFPWLCVVGAVPGRDSSLRSE